MRYLQMIKFDNVLGEIVDVSNSIDELDSVSYEELLEQIG